MIKSVDDVDDIIDELYLLFYTPGRILINLEFGEIKFIIEWLSYLDGSFIETLNINKENAVDLIKRDISSIVPIEDYPELYF